MIRVIASAIPTSEIKAPKTAAAAEHMRRYTNSNPFIFKPLFIAPITSTKINPLMRSLYHLICWCYNIMLFTLSCIAGYNVCRINFLFFETKTHYQRYILLCMKYRKPQYARQRRKGKHMKKITIKVFEELVLKDESLTAKAKEITGEGEELKEKIKAFAASMDYEIVPDEPQAISAEQLENVVGAVMGLPQEDHVHEWVFSHREKGLLWGYNDVYKCISCGATYSTWFKFWQ